MSDANAFNDPVELDDDHALRLIDDHLHGIDSVVTAATLVAVAFWWAGVQRADPISVLGLSISRNTAASFAGVLYFVVGVLVLWHLLTLCRVLEIAPSTAFARVLARLSLSSRIANPCAYMALRPSSVRSLSWIGIAYISGAWWLCSASVLVLGEREYVWPQVMVYAALRFVVFAWLIAIVRLQRVAWQRCADVQPLTLHRIHEWRHIAINAFVTAELCGVAFASLTILSAH